MKKIFRITITVVAISTVVFLLQDQLSQTLSNLQDKYLPCSQPITYSLGSFDKRFGISKEEFLRVVNIAKNTWEKSIDKNLFTYEPNGILKINLIYDARQEASQKLKNIGITVNDSRASFNDLKSKYNTMQAEYTKLKASFESRLAVFQNRQNAYENEVTSLNKNGGASREDYVRLNKEKNSLDAEFVEINKLQAELNTNVDNINAMAIILNRMVASLNIEVKKFNTTGDELGGEFEEGTYKEDSTGREIDIYQFDDEGNLARVLTHEFGHALGLDHLENTKAVMYRLNNGINEKLTIEDITALKKLCKIE